MIKPEMVPEAAWQQASGLWFNGAAWPQIIAAALNAWPGMHTHEWQRPWLGGMSGTDLILPLAQKQEDGDE